MVTNGEIEDLTNDINDAFDDRDDMPRVSVVITATNVTMPFQMARELIDTHYEYVELTDPGE